MICHFYKQSHGQIIRTTVRVMVIDNAKSIRIQWQKCDMCYSCLRKQFKVGLMQKLELHLLFSSAIHLKICLIETKVLCEYYEDTCMCLCAYQCHHCSKQPKILSWKIKINVHQQQYQLKCREYSQLRVSQLCLVHFIEYWLIKLTC